MDLKNRQQSFIKSFDRLEEVCIKAKSIKKDFDIFRDSTIQRFEIMVDAFWKCVKVFLKENEGVVCNSPKGCLRELFSNGYIDENTLGTLFKMVDDRNITSHTYNEGLADEIFNRIENYLKAVDAVKPCKGEVSIE